VIGGLAVGWLAVSCLAARRNPPLRRSRREPQAGRLGPACLGVRIGCRGFSYR
jgi:hypothetical protein